MNVIVSNKYQSMLETLQIDVIKSINGEFDADEIISTFQNFFFQRMILDITAIKDYKDIKNIQRLSISLDMSKVILLLDDSPECNNNEFLSKLISMGIYNFTKNLDGIMYLFTNPNTYRDVAHIQQLDFAQPQVVTQYVNETNDDSSNMQSSRIIGIKSITKDAGATTLTYLMKQELEKNYSVVAYEIDKRDFMFFRKEGLVSTTSTNIGMEIAKNKSDVVLIDLNNNKNVESLCETVLYLLEPSIIKLNKMLLGNSKMFKELEDKKVVLTKSLLTEKDVDEFEYESRLKVYYNMPPVNDHEDNIEAIQKLLNMLGFTR
ncbi:MAG TPA: hypothetical protein PLV83_02105 [Bacilli bacterium]|nr:hypothetical protein [Bacilli bacterium]